MFIQRAKLIENSVDIGLRSSIFLTAGYPSFTFHKFHIPPFLDCFSTFVLMKRELLYQRSVRAIFQLPTWFTDMCCSTLPFLLTTLLGVSALNPRVFFNHGAIKMVSPRKTGPLFRITHVLAWLFP